MNRKYLVGGGAALALALAAGFAAGRAAGRNGARTVWPLPPLNGTPGGAVVSRNVARNELSEFLALAAAGDYEGMARRGAEIFPAGAVLPPGWPALLREHSQSGPPNVSTYLFLDDETGGRRRKVMLIVDAGRGRVVDFLAESLRLVPHTLN